MPRVIIQALTRSRSLPVKDMEAAITHNNDKSPESFGAFALINVLLTSVQEQVAAEPAQEWQKVQRERQVPSAD